MKKFLLASTALVGAFTLVQRADAQQLTTDSPFTVRIDGFANFRGGWVDDSNKTGIAAPSDSAARKGAVPVVGRHQGFRTDTEIHVTATGKADNGLVYGMYVEIEADPALNNLTTQAYNAGSGGTQTVVPTSANNYIDEANIFLQGNWGRVEMGDQDGAADQLFFGAPYDYGPAYGQGSGADGDIMFRWANPVGFANLSSNIGATPLYGWNVKAIDSSDMTKFTYLTPVISGFRAGFSYAPGGEQNGFLNSTGPNARSNRTLTNFTSIASTGAVFGAANPAALQALSATLPANGTGASGLAQGLPNGNFGLGAYGDYQNWVEVGVQYRGTYNDIGFGVDANYVHANAKRSNFGANTQSALLPGNYHFNTISSWDIGAQVSWMGITVGGSYANHGQSLLLSGPGLGSGKDGQDIAAGIQYAIGPWVVGYNFSHSMNAGSLSPLAPGNDIIDFHSLGAKYILAPGLFLFTEYGHYNVVTEGQLVNSGNVGLLGTGIRF